MGVLSCRHRGGVTTGTHSPTKSVYVLKNCKYWKLRPGSDADLFMSRTLYIELSQMKSSASESINNDGLFQFETAQSREPRSLKTKTSKLCWPFNSERRILCWGLYRPPSSIMLLPSPCTAFSQSLSVNSFQWRIRDERAGNTVSHGSRDLKRFGREEKWGLGTNWKEHWIRILAKQRNSYHRELQHRLFKDSSIHA